MNHYPRQDAEQELGRYFAFNPNQSNANVGDTLEFQIYPGGHGVARSSYGNPCTPIEISEEGSPDHFWSGLTDPTDDNNVRGLPIYTSALTEHLQ
jgi:hypothetical protein